MAELSRGTLTDLSVDLGRAFAVVGAWCVFGLLVTALLVRRRHLATESALRPRSYGG